MTTPITITITLTAKEYKELYLSFVARRHIHEEVKRSGKPLDGAEELESLVNKVVEARGLT
jgi:hypothetical protein